MNHIMNGIAMTILKSEIGRPAKVYMPIRGDMHTVIGIIVDSTERGLYLKDYIFEDQYTAETFGDADFFLWAEIYSVVVPGGSIHIGGGF